MIYEKVVVGFTPEEIKYSILYWKVIETEMYSAFSTKGNVHPNDIYDFLKRRVSAEINKYVGKNHHNPVDLSTAKSVPDTIVPSPSVNDSLMEQQTASYKQQEADETARAVLAAQRAARRAAIQTARAAARAAAAQQPVAPIASATSYSSSNTLHDLKMVFSN